MTNPFESFYETTSLATNETQKREAFITLAASGFSDTQLARDMSLGAEYKVQFEQSGVVRRGLIDSYYGNLIVEFEFDLGATGGHAKDQLEGYVAGAWTEDGSAERAYLAVATDGLEWWVFTPSLEEPSLAISAENVRLTPNETFEVDPTDLDAFEVFLNRLFFRKTLLKPTAAHFTRDFGINSPTFTRARLDLHRKAAELQGDSQFELLRTEWEESLRLAYGGSVGSEELFVRHTYLASLARLLAFVALERRPLSDEEVTQVLGGEYFRGRQIANIAEDDFFTWHGIPSSPSVAGVWKAISHQLAGYDLPLISEDVLKPLYETLVDPETRHDLGEYYTPDWLAEQMVERLLQGWDFDSGIPSVVDPACGSGTFVRAAIAGIRERSESQSADQLEAILQNVVGVDVHPLAVIIARVTYVLAIADLIPTSSEAIAIPIYLSNSLEEPEVFEMLTLWGEDETNLTVGSRDRRRDFPVPSDFIRNVRLFDWAIDAVVEIAHAYADSEERAENARAVAKRRLRPRLDTWPTAVSQLSAMAVHLVKLIRDREDSVWGFLLRNRHRPMMLRGTFDLVVGNPPWLTVGDIEAAEYKDLVIGLATQTGIASRSAGEQAHTELATLFLPQAFKTFLGEGDGSAPAVGFVMPRSLLNATHHGILRKGGYKGHFRVSEIWDLEEVEPLFNVPACVIFCSHGHPASAHPIDGRVYKGRLPVKDVDPSEAAHLLSVGEASFVLRRLGRRTAWAEGDRHARPG